MPSGQRTPSPGLTPLQQAEQARRVVAVLGCMEDLIVSECRYGGETDRRGGATPIGRLLDDAAGATDAGAGQLAEVVARELACGLPAPLRAVGRRRPRWALALHGDLRRDGGHALDLVRATHRRLGGTPRHPSSRWRLPISPP